MDYKNVTVVSSKGQNIYPSCKMYQGDFKCKRQLYWWDRASCSQTLGVNNHNNLTHDSEPTHPLKTT